MQIIKSVLAIMLDAAVSSSLVRDDAEARVAISFACSAVSFSNKPKSGS